ncbi:SGNH/GDSL hydrolase family protein [Polaribacter sp.]|uniref:SGNH/GDSL hydrolase family protein n=1 Tax=Polaribacter sp. TaxID=1920175 RepID=UPI0025F436E1|nr:SGNH/GDSL hydrolase family protein [Polaribacter sp.]
MISRKKLIFFTILILSIVSIIIFKFKNEIKNEPQQENKIKLPGDKLTNFVLSRGEEYKLINSAIKQDYNISFDGNIVSFDTLIIGKGTKRFASSYIIITPDSLIFNRKYRRRVAKTYYKHNLSLKNNININISRNVSSTLVQVINEKDTLKITSDFIGMKRPFIRSIGSVINVNEFKFTCKDYNSDVFVFGDSYVNVYSPARWPYYTYKDYTFFCDGMPGGRSVASYDFLTSALAIHKPKYVIWCLGMNDHSKNKKINSSWKRNAKKVMALCTENNINLILATIPSVSKRNNMAKNKFVRASGYRYIDFDKAVSDGMGNWKNGMLAKDGTHPSALGAKALAEQFLKDFPEIKSYKK